MASRIIHYIVAKKICEKLNFENENAFILGSIAPDMIDSVVDRTAKKRAHFYEKYAEVGLKGYDGTKFYAKYLKNNPKEEFALGYYVHLLCDNIWVTDIGLKHVYNSDPVKLAENVSKNYQDMRKSNFRIADHYKVDFHLEPLEHFTIDEISINHQEELLTQLKKDFEPIGDESEFELWEWKTILTCVERCIVFSSHEIQRLMNGEEPIDPLNYMFPI